MGKTQRLEDLRYVIHEAIEKNAKSGKKEVDRKVKNLISIYKEISAIDEEISKQEQKKIWDIIHFAYVVNGGADIVQTGPNKYQITFVGKDKPNYDGKDIFRVSLRLHGRSIEFLDYCVY